MRKSESKSTKYSGAWGSQWLVGDVTKHFQQKPSDGRVDSPSYASVPRHLVLSQTLRASVANEE